MSVRPSDHALLLLYGSTVLYIQVLYFSTEKTAADVGISIRHSTYFSVAVRVVQMEDRSVAYRALQ